MIPYAENVLAQLQVPLHLIHMRDRFYTDHLLSVYGGLTVWCQPLKVRLGGLLHSIYGTERFVSWHLPPDQRQPVIDIVGVEAEALAYANCAIKREDIDTYIQRGFRRFQSRFSPDVEISFADDEAFRNFCMIHLCDWLDQVPLTGEWNYRFETYSWMANYLGGAPLAAFHWVYRSQTRKLRRAEPC